MTSQVVLFSYHDQIKFNIFTSKTVTKKLSMKLYYDLTDLLNAMNKLCKQISFHKYF